MNEMISKFVNQIDSENEYSTEYNAGIVIEEGKRFFIGWEQCGAIDTFSIGQPVFDKSGNLMGYLGINMYRNLNYSAKERIPVERWEICLPTKHCQSGEKVYTYWQNKKRMAAEERGGEE